MRGRSRGWVLVLLLFFSTPLPAAAEGVSLTPLSSGTFRTNFKYMVDGGESKSVKIPIPFYLIRHPQGVILFDSGLGENFRDQVRGWWVHRLFQLLLPYQFKRSDAAVYQIKKLGILPEEVRTIIVSHLHYDHAGGLRDFPQATVVVSRGEWEHANVDRWRAYPPLHRWRARLRGVMTEQLEGVGKRLWMIDYQPGTAQGPFTASLDLFSDGSLILLSTPGHTPGHQSLLVTLGSGRKVLLTGDAVWVQENYQKPAPKGWVVRTFEERGDEAWETTLKVKKFSEENPDIQIIPGHDPNLWPQLPEKFE